MSFRRFVIGSWKSNIHCFQNQWTGHNTGPVVYEEHCLSLEYELKHFKIMLH